MSLKTELQAALAYVNTKLAEKGAESASTVYGIGNKIETITVGSATANPSYFIDETVDTAVKVRNAVKASDNCLFIPFITDGHIHTTTNNEPYFNAQLATMGAVCAVQPPDLVIHGGDMINGSEAKSASLAIAGRVRNALRAIGGDNTVILIGNHDTNNYYADSSGDTSQKITEAEMLANWRNWNHGFTCPAGKLYGYRDFTAKGVRVVILHSSMGDSTNSSGANWGFPSDEVSWVRDTALNTNLDVVFFTHMTVTPEYQGTAYIQKPINGEALRTVIEDFVDGGGTVIGMFSGHAHWDYQGNHGKFFENVTCLSNYLTTYAAADYNPTDADGSYRHPSEINNACTVRGRTAGTAAQGLWDGIVINPTAQKVTMVRFGAGNDRVYYYGSSVAVTGVTLSAGSGSLNTGNNKTLTLTASIAPVNASVQSLIWSTSDGSVATVSDGIVTAVGEGSCTVTVTTVDGGFTDTCAITVAEGRTNMLPLSTAANGNAYGTSGYQSNTRLNSSGTEYTGTNGNGKYATGFIPVSAGKTVTLKNMRVNTAANDDNYIAFYDSSHNLIANCSRYARSWYSQTSSLSNQALASMEIDGNGYLTKLTLPTSAFVYGNTTFNLQNAAYFRLSANLIDNTSAVYVE